MSGDVPPLTNEQLLAHGQALAIDCTGRLAAAFVRQPGVLLSRAEFGRLAAGPVLELMEIFNAHGPLTGQQLQLLLHAIATSFLLSAVGAASQAALMARAEALGTAAKPETPQT